MTDEMNDVNDVEMNDEMNYVDCMMQRRVIITTYNFPEHNLSVASLHKIDSSAIEWREVQ